MEFITTVGYIIACILLFSFAIFIHEFGHFIVAKYLGFKVEVFSIGFGPALWKKTIKGVEYRISAIPFGGYVALPQLDPAGTKALENGNEKESDKKDKKSAPEKDPSTPLNRILVAFAGPFGNIVLAVILAFVLAAVPSAQFGEIPADIGEVLESGPAAKGGMKAGDKVLSINGNLISSWTEMQTEIQIAGAAPTKIVVQRGQEQKELTITPMRDSVTGACAILAVSTTNEAVKAAAWMPDRNPGKQLAWDAQQIVRVLKALVTPKESKAAAKALGGPVMIAEGLYKQVRRNRWDALGFLRFLNINLAMLNLLPIPVLDGGLIFFALFELLFRRKPPKKLVDNLSICFMWLFLSLMIFLVFRDVGRSRRIHKALNEYEQYQQQEKQNAERVKNFKPAFNLN